MMSVVLAAILAAALLAGCAAPDEAVDPGMQGTERGSDGPDGAPHANSLTWMDGPDSLPAGARHAVLSGDPTVDGLFTLRLEVPAGYTIPPHTHPAIEHVTILSGSAHLGMGTQVDRESATHLREGDFIAIEPGMEHYFVAGDGQVVLQLHGQGPWGIEYVDPADDPRGAMGP